MNTTVRSQRFAGWALLAICTLPGAPSLSHASDGTVRDVLSGCSVFKPNLKAGEVVAWKGGCSNGNAEGRGVALWTAQDGSSLTFEGTFSQGKLEGAGVMSASGGDRYEGTYRNGKRDGRGMYTAANGDRYEGEYQDNQRHGQGVAVSALGDRTLGEWRNGVLVATKPDAPSKAAEAPAPPVIQPQLPTQSVDQAARDLRDRQRAEQQQRAGVIAQQREDERALRQRAVQEQQRQVQIAEAAAQEQRRQAALTRQAAMDAERRLNTIVAWIVWLLPLVAAAMVAVFKWDAAVAWSDRFTQWIERRQERAREKSGFFNDFFVGPVSWCFQKLTVLTAGIESPSIKAAIRFAAWFYLAVSVLFLVYWVTVIAIGVAILVVIVRVLEAIFGESGRSTQRQSAPVYVDPVEDPDPVVSAGKDKSFGSGWFNDDPREKIDEDPEPLALAGHRGKKTYSGTSWIDEELQGRVDAKGNIYKGTNWANEEIIGRIDDDGRIHNGISGDIVGRLDADGTLYKGSGWFTEEAVGRIADDGDILKGTGWLNERKTGRTGD